MAQDIKVKGMDVPIVNLIPLRERVVKEKGYSKLKANIQAIGLIEPLCICKEDNQLFIVDGYIRYKILMELGVEVVPCLVLDSKDLYTPNRQVNVLSQKEEGKMLAKAMETLDQETIAQAFGIKSIKKRYRNSLLKHLHEDVVELLKAEKISCQMAEDLSYVVPSRQAEIISLMKGAGDWTRPFVHAQIVRTASSLRNKKKKKNTPWDKVEERKKDLARQLQEVEKRYDFYSTIYRQYVSDLLKLTIHIRQILNNAEMRSYLAGNYSDQLKMFESILEESEGKAAS